MRNFISGVTLLRATSLAGLSLLSAMQVRADIQAWFSPPSDAPQISHNSVCRDGSFRFALPIGNLHIGGSDQPVLIYYDSARGDMSFLPEKWNIPIANSCVYKLSESEIRVTFPGGQEQIYSFRQGGEDAVGPDGSNAFIKGSEVRIRCAKGDELRFRNGRLAELKSDGVVARWSYDDDSRLKEIVSTDGRLLLRLVHGGSGVDKSLEISGPIAGSNTRVNFSDSKLVPSVTLPRFLTIQDSLGQTFFDMKSNAGEDTVEVDFDGVHLPRMNLEFDSRTGIVSRIGARSYDIKEKIGGVILDVPVITEYSSNGALLLQQGRATDKRQTIIYDPYGPIEKIEYVYTKTGRKIKSRSFADDEKREFSEYYRAYFSENGNAFREILTTADGKRLDRRVNSEEESVNSDEEKK